MYNPHPKLLFGERHSLRGAEIKFGTPALLSKGNNEELSCGSRSSHNVLDLVTIQSCFNQLHNLDQNSQETMNKNIFISNKSGLQ